METLIQVGDFLKFCFEYNIKVLILFSPAAPVSGGSLYPWWGHQKEKTTQ
jgi:hypothetical protein